MATIQTFGRLVYIEPNDLMSNNYANGLDNNRKQWEPEEYNMSVDLQVVIPSRSDCMQIGSSIFHVQVNDKTGDDRYISFMQGSKVKTNEGEKDMLTTSYIDASYAELTRTGQVNRESLGIESVDITFDQHFYPQVTIKFIDVRGYSLMMPTEEQFIGTIQTKRTGSSVHGQYSNFFRALFHFPYPLFLLSVKGFYGTSITFMLAVNEFKNNFNSQTGNFEVTVSFIGYMYGLYTDLPMDMIIAAPYYGATKENAVTSDSWNGKHVFDENGTDGKDICTFIEYVDRCFSLKKATTELMKNNSDDTNINQVQEMDEKIKKLNAISDAFIDFASNVATVNKYENDGNTLYKDGTNNYKIWFFTKKYINNKKDTDVVIKLTGSDKENGVDLDESWKTFVKSWKDYEDTFGTSIFSLPPWTTSFLYNTDTNSWRETLLDLTVSDIKGKNYFYQNVNGAITEVTEGSPLLGDVTLSLLSEEGKLPELSNFIKNLENADIKTGYVIAFFTKFMTEGINGVIANLKSEIYGKTAGVIEEMNQLYIQHLGFTPHILNVFRMIFAHIECFMTEFNDILKEIKDSKRTLADFGKELNETDLPLGIDKEKGFVPPFPAFYEKVDGNIQLMYPGDNEKFRDLMPEVRFVENLLNGVLGLKKLSNDILTKHAEIEKYNDQMLNNGNDGYFYPTSLSDMYLSQSPYKNMSMKSDGMETVVEILKLFLTRAAMSYFQIDPSKAGGDSIGITEAKNFLKIQKMPTDEIKTAFNTLATNDAEIEKILKEKIYNSTILGIKNLLDFSGNKSFNDIPKEKRPVFFTNYNSSSGAIFAGDKKSKYVMYANVPVDVVSRLNDMINKQQGENGSKYISNDVNGGTLNKVNITFEETVSSEKLLFKEANNIPSFLRIDADIDAGDYIMNNNMDTKYFLSNDFKDDDKSIFNFLILFTHAMYRSDVKDNNSAITLYARDLKRSIIVKYPFTLACLLGVSFKLKCDANWGKLSVYNKTQEIVNNVNPDSNLNSNPFIFNEKDDPYSLLTSIYDEFKNSSEWKEIYKALKDKSNYRTTSNGNMAMNDKLKLILFRNLVDFRENDYKSRFVYLGIEGEHNNSTHEKIVEEVKSFITTVSESYNGSETITEQLGNPDIQQSTLTKGHKLALYKSLKNLYDKWMNSYRVEDFRLPAPQEYHDHMYKRYIENVDPSGENHSEFENFLFVDAFQKDISYLMKINPRILSQMLVRCIEADSNPSVYEFTHELLRENHLLFQALPVYNNFYNEKSIDKIFRPHLRGETMKVGFGSTYVCMYVYEVSHAIKNSDSFETLADDGFDLCDVAGDPSAITGKQLFGLTSGNTLNYIVPSFGVTYGRQGQSYFKNIGVNMDNPRVTDYSIANLFSLASLRNNKALEDPNIIGNDLYNIYANRSYNCKVDMMGCANIMPMMYFQLNNIPMFRGAYMISNVEHHIRAGQFETTFSGVRINKTQIPFIDGNFTFFDNLDVSSLNAYDSGGLTPDENIIPYTTSSSVASFFNQSGKVEISKAEIENNWLVWVEGGPNGQKVQVHKSAETAMRKFFYELNHGSLKWFKLKSISGYSYRTIAHTKKLSNHAYGLAIDINPFGYGCPYFKVKRNSHPEWEPPIAKTKEWVENAIKKNNGAWPWPYHPSYQTPYKGEYDESQCIWYQDHPVVKFLEKFGFGWGGLYGDTMHFSLLNGW